VLDPVIATGPILEPVVDHPIASKPLHVSVGNTQLPHPAAPHVSLPTHVVLGCPTGDTVTLQARDKPCVPGPHEHTPVVGRHCVPAPATFWHENPNGQSPAPAQALAQNRPSLKVTHAEPCPRQSVFAEHGSHRLTTSGMHWKSFCLM
jgi:hypothetical protein